MFLTSKARYAVMGMLEIASKEPFSLTKLADIALNQEIEVLFLEQIFAKLKGAGLVEAVRGPGGGYRLAKRADAISISEIIRAVEEDIKITRCAHQTHSGRSNGCLASGKVTCATHHLWAGLENQIEEYFSNKTLLDVQNQRLAKTPSLNNIYFDHNSTTSLLPEIKKEMLELFQRPLNASSTHANGRDAKHYLENARSRVKEFLKADSQYNVVFTSSGTEANNLAILGIKNVNPLVSVIEHSSILGIVSHAIIKVLPTGAVDLAELEKFLTMCSERTPLVSVMLANNETGVIQPIKDIVYLAKKKGAIVHTDATQAPGKIAIDINDLAVDMMTISAHKFGGPLGAAALIYKKNLDIKPIIIGGGQEYRLRSGTHNIHAIHGFGLACSLEEKYRNLMAKTEPIRDYIEEEILNIASQAVFFGKGAVRLPNTSSISMPNVTAEAQIIHFDTNGIAISNGSACSSGTSKLPHVHMAMGYSLEEAKTATRISLGINNTHEEAKRFIQVWKDLYLRSNKLIKDAI
ncbi:MAG: DNA-binding transcriptional regulator, IscR family [Candidatus Midichloria mitochondrii]|uniref:cysteine desulfurase n=1 Tax=Midichloria mitochondrii (strain IricVA) TaxID=696127 RepID=F7XV99_MIDMI|nr:aminotransferase class V-fold PLP-dependent enzyme [Candidatus Midichloria mitochondrii]AEI88598.1 cysteine desulfurase 2 [Candidatus Midichloria mitochondrii IricVA]MDJ1256785.1 aminotransferase class V-fold PLP-dependent enzyme [Candidatus Midichloria mitochondrii]MDJ1288509.1 aminotransferase class V-fold PLP-dependent enzyme [Candidatus Midichloria mitochondrii]MDJ1299352.1 aminotransferase class V-fold PLP-dependent enzyme [Candidatus Midichloria mitochondrii]MDJ1313444.1 aminotransfer